jgi:fatty-acyl-CoA synthase
VLHEGVVADADGLQAFCKANLASYKVPRHVFVVAEAEVPRTGTGKIEKPALRKMAQARLA